MAQFLLIRNSSALSMGNRVTPFSGGSEALPSAAASGGGGRVLLPFFTVPTHKRTNSLHGRRRSCVENVLSAGVLAEPQGDELAAGLLNGLCCLDRGAADLILYSLVVESKECPCFAQSCVLASFSFPVELCHAVCLSDPVHGC